MKKLSLLAATLMATAFCGMCAGCAQNVESVSEGMDIAPASVTASAETTTPKVILNPGWYWTSGAKDAVNNTVADGATALTKSEADAYHVENGYFATVAAGADLPVAATTRTGMTFAGWTYAKDGDIVTIEKMPASLTENLYLFAKWDVKGSSQGGGHEDPPPVTSDSYMQVGSQQYALSRNTGASREEYWLGGVKVDLAVGNKISLYMDGKKVSAYIERNSSGVELGDEKTEYDEFSVTLGGAFDVYLHKNANDWSVQFVVTTEVVETTVTIPANAVYSDITFKNGTVRVYFKDGDNFATSFSEYKLYMWDGSTEYFGKWADVKEMTAAMDAKQYDINANVQFILRKGSGQTRDLSGMEAGGTYLITYSTNDTISKVEKIKVA